MRLMGAKAGGRQPGRVDGFIDRARGMSMHKVRSKWYYNVRCKHGVNRRAVSCRLGAAEQAHVPEQAHTRDERRVLGDQPQAVSIHHHGQAAPPHRSHHLHHTQAGNHTQG